ncbi:MAG: zinc-binding alcohol dehydrogenase [Planctomycetota bacterium]
MPSNVVVFPAALECVFDQEGFETAANKPDDVVLKTLYSVVSAGTEGALYRGTESWAKHPIKPGYGAVGEVVALGEQVTDFKLGDIVFTYGNHATYVRAKRMMLKVPDGVDPKLAVMARMAQVSFTSLRVADAALGDTVAIIGQGLVGNIAAQLFTLAGCKVIGIDVMPSRLALAERCGVEHTINALQEDVVERVKEITDGRLCATVIEASGIPDQALTAARLAGKKGEVVLLGSPRGEFRDDAVDLLNQVHLWDRGCVTFKGAHEWRLPDKASPKQHYKHSIEGNLLTYFDLVRRGKLNIEPLISHVVKPEGCADIYAQLHGKNEEFMGVLFDWKD